MHFLFMVFVVFNFILLFFFILDVCISKKTKVIGLSNFQRRQIAGACIAGSTIKEIADIVAISRGSVSKRLK